MNFKKHIFMATVFLFSKSISAELAKVSDVLTSQEEIARGFCNPVGSNNWLWFQEDWTECTVIKKDGTTQSVILGSSLASNGETVRGLNFVGTGMVIEYDVKRVTSKAQAQEHCESRGLILPSLKYINFAISHNFQRAFFPQGLKVIKPGFIDWSKAETGEAAFVVASDLGRDGGDVVVNVGHDLGIGLTGLYDDFSKISPYFPTYAMCVFPTKINY